jgi:hypothetical protein
MHVSGLAWGITVALILGLFAFDLVVNATVAAGPDVPTVRRLLGRIPGLGNRFRTGGDVAVGRHLCQ